jgi:uncharacterized protein YndB with AHSA1/START domain
VPTVSRSRTIDADPGRVWDVVSDPWHLPRWWPRVERVEDATEEAWTKVMLSPRGKAVRADYTRVEAEPPRRMVWRHEVEESPFERVFAESLIEISLEPEDGGTRVRMTAHQKLRGKSRFGAMMVRRATRRRFGEALDGLSRIVGA